VAETVPAGRRWDREPPPRRPGTPLAPIPRASPTPATHLLPSPSLPSPNAVAAGMWDDGISQSASSSLLHSLTPTAGTTGASSPGLAARRLGVTLLAASLPTSLCGCALVGRVFLPTVTARYTAVTVATAGVR
jgi:hypothetical protein